MRAPAQLGNGTVGMAKRWLFTAAIVLATVCLMQDSRPASASDAQILLSLSNSVPTYVPAIYLVPDGPGEEVYVWAKDVGQATSAFEVDVTYDASMVSVTSLVEYVDWLEMYGRSASCTTPLIEPVNSWDPEGPWHANVSCITIGLQGSGTQGNGLLAKLTLESTGEVGVSDLTLSEGSFLLDMNIDPVQIPVQRRSSVARTSPCADFSGDGVVRIGDVLFVVNNYGMEGDPIADQADLDGDGYIRVGDVIIALGQYGLACER